MCRRKKGCTHQCKLSFWVCAHWLQRTSFPAMTRSLIFPQGFKHVGGETSKSGMASFIGRWEFNCCPPLFYQDAFQEEYYRTGTYPAVPIVPPRRPWTLLNWLFWALLLLYPLFKLLINMFNSGSSLTLASFGFVIVMGKFSPTESSLEA